MMKMATLCGALGLALVGSVRAEEIPARAMDRSVSLSEAEIAAHRVTLLKNAEGGAERRSLLDSAARGDFLLFDTFDSYPCIDSYLTGYEPPLIGNAFETPDGGQLSGWAFRGVVDKDSALSNMDGDPSNGEYRGPPEGPDPTCERGKILQVQRASVNDPRVDEGFGQLTYRYASQLYAGAADRPLFVEIDIYKPNHETFQWVRPVSFTQGSIATQILMGGYVSNGLFLPLAQRYGDPDLVEGAIFLASQGVGSGTGEFVLNPKEISEGGWFTLGVFIDSAVGSMAVFVRDDETLADADMDGSPDWKMPVNQETGLRMFEEFGYGLEEGWASVLPGTLDDPMTSDIEGAGYALNGAESVTARFFANGNDVAPVFGTITVDALDIFRGSDPAPADLPGYEIQDWWLDDYRIRGVALPPVEELPEYVIPYVDDFELWNVGPLGLQGRRWFVSPNAGALIVDGVNYTLHPERGADGVPDQALRLQNAGFDLSYETAASTNLPTTPRVRGEVSDPAMVSAAVRYQTIDLSYGIDAYLQDSAVEMFSLPDPLEHDADKSMGRVFTSGIDENGLGDGLVYVRQRKPVGTDIAGGEFDPTQPLASVGAANRTPGVEASLNTEYINVLAAPAGQGSFSLGTNQWHEIRMSAEPDPMGGAGILRVEVNTERGGFVELFPEGDAASSFVAGTLAPTDLRFTTSSSTLGGFATMWIDDVRLSGPTDADTVVPLGASYADDPAWQFPFLDGFDTYETGRPASGQGFANHRQEFLPVDDPDGSPLPNDWDEIWLADGAPALQNGDLVRVYEIVSIDGGSPGLTVGDILAVSDDLFREYDPDEDIYGVINDGLNDPTEWRILDAVDGSEVAHGTWYLLTTSGLAVFDDQVMEDIGVRYAYRQDFRFGGTERENTFVNAAEEGVDSARGSSRGDVVKLTNTGNVRDYRPGGGLRNNSIEMFSAFLPLLQTTAASDEARMRFDMYVGQEEFATGMHALIEGGTADGGLISAIGFGGEGFPSGNTSTEGVLPFAPTGNFTVLEPNPDPMLGEPQNVWVDTGVAVPTEAWFTVEVIVNGDSEYTISVIMDDGLTEIASGAAIDASEPQLDTNSLDKLSFVRNQFGERDGEITPGIVKWSARAFDAPAPLTGGVGAYHFYEIMGEIVVEAGQMLPSIWPVDSASGAPDVDMMGTPVTRALQFTDIVAVVNVDPATGQPLDDPFISDRFEIADAGGTTLVASGQWEPRGVPGYGVGTDAPAGGLEMGATPAYNAAQPFFDIVLADYVEVAANTVLPADVWYVDNLQLEPVAVECFANIDGLGEAVDAGDLATLLAAWGSTNPAANLDGIGVVDAGDLAILLASWGPCP